MSVRISLKFDLKSLRYQGVIDFGDDDIANTDNDSLADHALVFGFSLLYEIFYEISNQQDVQQCVLHLGQRTAVRIIHTDINYVRFDGHKYCVCANISIIYRANNYYIQYNQYHSKVPTR